MSQIVPPFANFTLFANSQFPDSKSGASSRDTPEAIEKTAVQFEALLIGEVLKSAREAGSSGWLGTDESEAGSSLMEVSEQQVAQALATSGGFGLAKMVAKGLAKASAHRSRPPAAIEKG